MRKRSEGDHVCGRGVFVPVLLELQGERKISGVSAKLARARTWWFAQLEFATVGYNNRREGAVFVVDGQSRDFLNDIVPADDAAENDVFP